MKKATSQPNQLSFSLGRPLSVLLEEVERTTRHPQLREAAKQMQKALHTFELAKQTQLSKSHKANQAIYEILTK
ncbi:MAG: hypothetical protein AB4058_05045 [Microcystaceae cyanobacterium]